jgi:hypothetical protein
MLLKAIKPPARLNTQRFDSEREGHKHTYISAAQRRDNISRGCKTHTDEREHQMSVGSQQTREYFSYFKQKHA